MIFSGPAFDPKLDEERLSNQILRIYRLMNDQEWRTLAEIAGATGDPEASVSAQLRHLRKKKFGGFVLNRRRRGMATSGLHEYQLLPPGVATVKRVTAKTGFLAGMMHAAKIVVGQTDLAGAKSALKSELLKVAKR